MKPLRSPIIEYAVLGVVHMLTGVAIALIALGTKRLGVVAGTWLFGATFFGGVMYALAYRRYFGSALREARAAPVDATYETADETYRRVILWALASSVPLLVFALVLRNPAVVAGIPSGNGATLVILSRRMLKWEKTNDSRLLREPRYRWRRVDRRRGRGVMDARDFYIAHRRAS
ncbi:MAG: hypothetical protein M3Z18_04615 [Gemmatimonadota bacterium]|nr:hypothetical protein [Gemmatimonadota bacterium]